MAEKINIIEWMIENLPSTSIVHTVVDNTVCINENNQKENCININKYIDMYNKQLSESKGVRIFNNNSIDADFEDKEHSCKYIVLNNIYILMLKNINLSYEKPEAFQLLNELCTHVGFFPYNKGK